MYLPLLLKLGNRNLKILGLVLEGKN